MLSEHIAAAKALLAAAGFVDITGTSETVTLPEIGLYDGQVPGLPTYPYLVLWTPPGDRLAPTLDNQHTQFETRLHTTYVGNTAEQVRIVVGKAHGALLDVRPLVAGRACWKLTTLFSEPIRQDTDVTIPGSNLHPMYGVDVWRLASIPA